MTVSEPRLTYIGVSRDARTNRWRVTPCCGHKPFEPPTTRLSSQRVSCPKCGAEYRLDLNAHTIVRVTYGAA